MNIYKRIIKGAALLLLVLATITSCGEYNKFDNNEVITNSFTGNVIVTSVGSDPGGDFTGSDDSGTYAFAWVNSGSRASLNFDITSPTGSVQFIINDKKGDEVLNETLIGGSNEDTFSGISSEGKSGTWKITIVFKNFDGDGSYSIHPGS